MTASSAPAEPDVIITHDFAELYGGAERVTQELAIAFPRAEVWTVLGRPAVVERMGVADRWRTVLPPRRRLLRDYRMLAPAFPAVVAHARLPETDVLLSSSYAYAHHFRTANGAPQVCYCHSPLRFAWSMTAEYADRWARTAPAHVAFDALAAASRRADRRAASRVRTFLTQSPFTAAQIERSYGRAARVVGAPVDCERFRPATGPAEPEDWFLASGRLIEPYKKMTVAIEAFRRLGRRLVIAGDGPAMRELRAQAPRNVSFTGHLDDEDLVRLMQRCAAVIFPSRDDFGLIPVEAMACGRPVLAFAGGGARHTVLAGVTGELFDAQTPEAIVAAVARFDPARYDPRRIRDHALRWDRRRFRATVREAVLNVARSGR